MAPRYFCERDCSAGSILLYPTMKRLLLTSALMVAICLSAFADKAVNIYNAPTGSGKSIANGCSYVQLDLSGFTGTISGATYSNQTLQLQIHVGPSTGDVRLSAIPYTVTSGTLRIVEVR